MDSRLEFNEKLFLLLEEMTAEGEHWLLDFIKRSTEEQHRLWLLGRDEEGNIVSPKEVVTRCDGYITISWHQYGRAVDIYFVDGKNLVNPIKGYRYWHDVWKSLGGHEMIEGDEGHFEG